MRIAIFNGFEFHYEMFGYLIDFFKNAGDKGNEIHLYSEQKNNMDWFRYYLTKFPKTCKLFHYTTFSPSLYDIIIILTDCDPFWKKQWASNRVLCIDHSSLNRRPEIPEIKHIATRYFPSHASLSWCLPVMRMIDLEQKKKIVNPRKMVCIGSHVKDKKISDLAKGSTDLEIVLIDRHLDPVSYQEIPNVTCIKQCSTIDMIEHLSTAMYVYVSDVNVDHFENIMSSSIPLALNNLCSLIIPAQMNQYYNISSALTVENMKLVHTSQQIDLVHNDLENYLSRRNAVLSEKIDMIKKENDKPHKNTVMMIEPREISHVVTILHEYYKYFGDTWNYVFYCGKNTTRNWKKYKFAMDIEFRELYTDNFTATQYNDFMKQKSVWESLYGEFVLTVQVDTWPMNMVPIETFMYLNQSYIGGAMPQHWRESHREGVAADIKYCNGNGGLSLRKRLDMIRVLETYPPLATIPDSMSLETDAEDVYFYLGCKRLGLPIGNDIVSSHFALHYCLKDKWFGIHNPGSHIVPMLNEQFPHLKTINPYLKL
jgi:hypothetical protein